MVYRKEETGLAGLDASFLARVELNDYLRLILYSLWLPTNPPLDPSETATTEVSLAARLSLLWLSLSYPSSSP
jgi:hypothetical protein